MTEPQIVPTPEPTVTQQPLKRKRSLLRIIASVFTLTLTAAIFAVVGGVMWLLGSEKGLQFAVLKLPELLAAPVRIDAKTLQGSVWNGFSGSEIVVETETANYEISSLAFAWQPQKLADEHLHITRLAAGDIHIATKPDIAKPKETTPVKLPESVNLPFTAAIDKLEVGQITQGKQKTVLLSRGELSYQYNHQHHAVNVVALKTPWSNSAGQFSLATATPYALQGKMDLTGVLDDIAVTGDLNVSGSLKDVALATKLQGLGIHLQADTQVKPFALTLGEKIGHVRLVGEGVNPKSFLSTLPKANLSFSANVLPDLNNEDNMGLSGKILLNNKLPLPADKQGVPVKQLDANLSINQSGAIEIVNAHALLMKSGELSLKGGIYAQKQTLNLQADLKNITAADVLQQNFAGVLNGKLHTTGTFLQPETQFALNTDKASATGIVKLLTDVKKQQRTVLIDKGIIQPNQGGKLNLSGSLELFNDQKLQAKISSEQFNPRKLHDTFPEGSVNGTIDLTGELAKLAFHSSMAFTPSQLSGTNLSGGGKVSYENNHLSKADVAIVLGSNVLKTQGAFGKKGDTLALDLNAPNIAQFGFGMSGLLQAKGSLTSTADGFTQLDAQLDGQIRQLNIPNAVQVQHLDFKLHGSPDMNRPLDVALKGNGIVAGGTAIDNADFALKGTVRQHHLAGSGSLKIDNKPLSLDVVADGGLNEQNQWIGTVGKLDVSGALNLHLNNTMRLEAGQQRVAMSAARWQALGGSLALDTFVWDKQNGLTTKGRGENLQISQLHNWYTPPIEHNLVLSGDWDLAYSQSPRGYLNVRQQSGDVILPTARKQALNLSNLVLNTQLNSNGILTKLSGNTRYTEISGSLDILQAFGGGALAEAPIRGKFVLNSAELEMLRSFLPVGHSLRGKLVANLDLTGKLNAPQLSGTLNGDNLNYRNRDVGIILADGSLKSHFEGQKWVVDSLLFKRGNGTINLTGTAAYLESQPDVNAKIVFTQYQLLDQPNRRLTVSGNTDLTYTQQGMTLSGSLKTDEGRFGFQASSAPTLGDDVVVIGETKAEPSAAVPMNINLVFDLNDKFYFSGEGLNVQLGGQLTLTAKPKQDMQAVGSVLVKRGRYKAYGQDLVIKKGIISFVGPLDQPNLNIRAERRNSPVGAGVEVLGNLNTPRITLVANDPMSEKDKLSWLILNRASSGSSGDETAIATAASAWLAGGLNDKVGLVDDFGLTSSQTRNAATGEMNPAQQMVTFGKQLSRDLYLGYEAGLGDASQSVKLVYQLSRSFQAIARAGTVSSGAELKYVKRFDGFSKKKRAEIEAQQQQSTAK